MRKLLLVFIPVLAGMIAWLQFSSMPQAAAQLQVTLESGKTVSWPPVVGQPYPDLELKDHRGNLVKLSDFKGKVILIEPIGMTCPACNAFAGADKKGAFKGMGVQGGLGAIEDHLPQYAGGIKLDDPRIVYVPLLLYNLSMQGPTEQDAKDWAEHFGIDKRPNTYVLAGTDKLVNQASYDLIPGFQLVDRDFILVSDSAGHHPQHSMWSHLMPMIPKLLEEKTP